MTPTQLKVMKLTAEILLSQYKDQSIQRGSLQSELAVALIDMDDEATEQERTKGN